MEGARVPKGFSMMRDISELQPAAPIAKADRTLQKNVQRNRLAIYLRIPLPAQHDIAGSKTLPK